MSFRWKISTLKSELVGKKHSFSLREAQIVSVKNAYTLLCSTWQQIIFNPVKLNVFFFIQFQIKANLMHFCLSLQPALVQPCKPKCFCWNWPNLKTQTSINAWSENGVSCNSTSLWSVFRLSVNRGGHVTGVVRWCEAKTDRESDQAKGLTM